MATQKVPTLDGSGKVRDKHLPTRLSDGSLNATIVDQFKTSRAQVNFALTAPLAPMAARAERRHAQPTTIVLVGTSTIGGVGASIVSRALTNLLSQSAQATFPVEGTLNPTMTLDAAAATPPTRPGIHIVYQHVSGGGVGQMTTTHYDKIAAVKPAAILYLWGANDARSGMSAETFRATMETHMDGIASRVTGPLTQIIVSQPPQSTADWTVANYSLWVDTALAAIARARPSTTFFIDTVEAFASIGVTGGTAGTDLLGVVHTDKVHPSDAGHALLADIIRRALLWAPAATAGSASGGAGQQVSPWRVISDTFTGTGNINSVPTDNLLGGTATNWNVSSADQWTRNGGTVRRVDAAVSASDLATVALPAGDSQATVVLATPPTQGVFIMVFNAQSGANATNVNRMIRFAYDAVQQTLYCQWRQESGGATITFHTRPVPAAEMIGARLMVRRYADQISWIFNGQVLHTEPAGAQPGGGFVGLLYSGTNGSPTVDAIVVDRLI